MRKLAKACIGLALAILLISASPIGAEETEEGYGLLWSYEIGDWVDAVSVSADGSFIAAGSPADDKVYFFNREGEPLWSYQTGGSVTAVSVSADGSFIAAGSYDDKVYLFNREGELLWSYQTGDDVIPVSVSADGSFIAAGSGDCKVYFFNREGEVLWSYQTWEYYQTWQNVDAVSVSADGSFIAAGSRHREVYFFNREGELLWSYQTGAGVDAVSVSADGSLIAAGSSDNKVYLFNRQGELLWSYQTGGYVDAVSVSADGSFIAAGSEDNKVYFFIASSALRGLLDEVSGVITQEKAKGFDVARAEELLAQAEKAFQARDYQSARPLALRAKSIAVDIDGDGVRNEGDFAPTVHNTYIYIGGAAILASLALVTPLAVRRRRERRVYLAKVRQFEAELKQWEDEGYDVSELRKEWFG